MTSVHLCECKQVLHIFFLITHFWEHKKKKERRRKNKQEDFEMKLFLGIAATGVNIVPPVLTGRTRGAGEFTEPI